MENLISYITIAEALICANCDTIYSMRVHETCPVCTSKFYLKLEPVLGKVSDLSATRQICKTEENA